ncbi:MAG: dockerin type I domain-containing protein [Patescibacteria group bacterium]
MLGMKWYQIFIIFISFVITFGFFNALAAPITTSVVTTAPTITLTQSDFRWYSNADSLTPGTALDSENTETTVPAAGTTVRLRINLQDTILALPAGAIFKLQYSATTSSGWADVTTSTPWIFSDNPGVSDGQIIVAPVLGNSNVGESYSESNPTAETPNEIPASQRGEWDWVIKNNSAATTNDWFFRMIYSSGTVLDSYTRYPTFSAQAQITPPAPPPQGGTVQVPPTGGGPPLRPPLPRITERPPSVSNILDTLDLNGDRRIDIRDFSILLYYYGRRDKSVARSDFNGDGTVSMADVSILLYYWTT